jgi:hypothetical protein
MPKKGDPCPWCRLNIQHMISFPHTMTTHKNCLYKHDYPRVGEEGPAIRLIKGVHKPDGAVQPFDIQSMMNVHHGTPVMDEAEDYSLEYDINTLFLATVYPEKVPRVLALPSREPTHAEVMNMTLEQLIQYKQQQADKASMPLKPSLKPRPPTGLNREDSLMSAVGALEASKEQARRDLDSEEKDLQARLASFERETQARREEFSRQQKRIAKSQKQEKASVESAVKKFVAAAKMSTDEIKACMTEQEYQIFHTALLDPTRTFALKRTSTRNSAVKSELNRTSRVRYCLFRHEDECSRLSTDDGMSTGLLRRELPALRRHQQHLRHQRRRSVACE